MAVTKKNSPANALMAAALALPMLSLLGENAHAESAPEKTTIGVKYLKYQDYQDSGTRIKIEEPVAYIDTPLSSDLELQAHYIADTISGASPAYQTRLVKGIKDKRNAVDAKLIKYFDNYSIGFGAGVSREHDYESRSFSLDTRIDFNNKNTTLALGVGTSDDRVGSTINRLLSESKNSTDMMVGITQILSPKSLIQANLSYSLSRGYLSDPYKFLDNRPDRRDQTALLVRYVQFISPLNGALHADYRFFENSWSVNGNTIDLSWYQNIGDGWRVIPGVRYYWQSQAKFYQNQFPPDPTAIYYSSDQRLSSFGAITPSIKISKEFQNGVQADIKYEYYTQSSTYAAFGNGTPGVDPMMARALTFGLSYSF